jgi:hypothetical protein
VEKIQLSEKDPIIHGASVHDGYMWYGDDVGYICTSNYSYRMVVLSTTLPGASPKSA